MADSEYEEYLKKVKRGDDLVESSDGDTSDSNNAEYQAYLNAVQNKQDLTEDNQGSGTLSDVSLWDVTKAAGRGLWNTVAGIPQIVGSAVKAQVDYPYLPPGIAQGVAFSKYAYENPQVIAPTAAGLLSTGVGLLNPVAGGLTGATTFPLAQLANEKLGLTEPLSDKDRFLSNVENVAGIYGPLALSSAVSGINRATSGVTGAVRGVVDYGKGILSDIQAPEQAANAFLQQPATQDALTVARAFDANLNNKLLDRNASRAGNVKLNQSTEIELENAQNITNNLSLKDRLAAFFGLTEGGADVAQGNAQRFLQRADNAIADPDFYTIVKNANNLEDFQSGVTTKLVKLGNDRINLINALEDKGFSLNPEALKPVLDQLDAAANTLKQSGFVDDQLVAQALETRAYNYLKTMGERGGDFTPSELLARIEENNRARRASGEFNRLNQGKLSANDATAFQADEIINKARGLENEVIKNILDRAADPSGQTTPFSTLQDRYGGFSAIKEGLDFAISKTRQGQGVSGQRVLVRGDTSNNAFTGAVPLSPKAAVSRVLGAVANKLVETESDPSLTSAIKMQANIADSRNRMQAIKATMRLQENPVDINQMDLISRSVNRSKPQRIFDSIKTRSLEMKDGYNPNFPVLSDPLAVKMGIPLAFNAYLQNPPPLLPRNSETIKQDPMLEGQVALTATQLGLTPTPQVYAEMSDSGRKEVQKQIVQMMPQIAEPTPGNYPTFDGKYLNPADRDSLMQTMLDQPASERAKFMPHLLLNRVIAPKPQPIQSTMPLTPEVDLSAVQQSLNTAGNIDYSFNGSKFNMLDRLNQSIMEHAEDEVRLSPELLQ